jgi:hypothetical protein
MLHLTKKALEEFDNQHDFERMCADILNALGCQKVEPMAPAGGPDGGKDIIFYEGETKCAVFVTLRKDIGKKFDEDSQKLKILDRFDKIVLFSNQNISQKQKEDFIRIINSKGILFLEIFDLERLRSLLDASLKTIRKKYLHIDDEISEKILAAVKKTLEFPDAIVIDSKNFKPLEEMFFDDRPRKLFYTLLDYDQKDISGITQIGGELNDFKMDYYQFKQQCNVVYSKIIESIRPLIKQKMSPAWDMYAKYCILRFGRFKPKKADDAIGFWNFGITAADAEHVYQSLITSDELFPFEELEELFKQHNKFITDVTQITARLKSTSEK